MVTIRTALIATLGFAAFSLAITSLAPASRAAAPADAALISGWTLPPFPVALKTGGFKVDNKALKKLSASTSFASLVGNALTTEADKKATAAAKRKAWCDTLRSAARLPRELDALLRPACQAARARVAVETDRFVQLHVSHSWLMRYGSSKNVGPKLKARAASAYLAAFKDFKGHALVKDVTTAGRAWAKGQPHDGENTRHISEQACDRADGLSCVVAGIILEDTPYVPTSRKDPLALHAKMAKKRYQQACTMGNDLGCMHQALVMLRQWPKSATQAQSLLRSACARLHGDSCHQLALLYRHGIGVPRSHEKAKQYATAGCSSGDGGACATLALAHLKGRRPNQPKAAQLYRQACSWGNARGCAGEAFMSEFGLGVKKNPKSAFKGYSAACAAGWGVACDNAATMLDSGKGARRDHTKALATWMRGCILGWGLACSKVGHAVTAGDKPLSQKHPWVGRVMQRDACSDGHGSACVAAGHSYESGIAGGSRSEQRPNHRKAIAFYDHACKGLSKGVGQFPTGEWMNGTKHKVFSVKNKLVAKAAVRPRAPQGCVELARIYYDGVGVQRDQQRALSVISAACRAKLGPACRQRGDYLRDGAAGGAVAHKGALAAYERGCTLGDTGSCTQVGFMHLMGLGTTKDGGKALPFLARACDAKDMRACGLVATIHFTGAGIEKNQKKGMALYKKACSGGNPNACANAAFNHLAGTGAKKSPALALKFFKSGCALQHDFSCEHRDKLVKK